MDICNKREEALESDNRQFNRLDAWVTLKVTLVVTKDMQQRKEVV